MAMKPPGGDSHDLFGAEFTGTPCHHRVLKPPGGGTSDIFGAPDPGQSSPRRVRNNMQSSVFAPPANDGNPVTGEGYSNGGDKQPLGGSAVAASAAAAAAPNGASHSAPPQRGRVPPGGYSSGLW